MNFSNEINKALAVMRYQSLLPVQEQVIPKLMEDINIAVKAKTGSGKTAAFAIPMCEKVEWDENKPQVLVLVCTRELALQIEEEFRQIGRFKKIRCVSLIGKKNMDYQKDQLKQKCHVVVATPGRLLDHLENENIDLSNIRHVIIDEADYMLEMGFLEQTEQILEKLPANCVKALFSATYPQKIKNLIDRYVENVEWINLEETCQIHHYYVETEHRWRDLLRVLESESIESAMIFCATQNSVDELYQRLHKMGILVSKIHGAMPQKKRIQNVEKFRRGESRILIATDVAARGLDIDQVTHVIHYDMPSTFMAYTHRCGRSGRLDKEGTSILLCETNDFSLLEEEYELKPLVMHSGNLDALKQTVIKKQGQNYWKGSVTKLHLNAGKEKKLRVGDIIGALCSIDGVDKDDIGVVEVLSKMTFVEVLNGKEQIIMDALKEKTIKNKKVKAELAK